MPTPRILAVGYLSVDRIDTPGGRHERRAGRSRPLCGPRRADGGRPMPPSPRRSATIIRRRGSRPSPRSAIDVSRVERRPGATRTAHITYSRLGARASPHHDDSGWWERTEALTPCCKAMRRSGQDRCRRASVRRAPRHGPGGEPRKGPHGRRYQRSVRATLARQAVEGDPPRLGLRAEPRGDAAAYAGALGRRGGRGARPAGPAHSPEARRRRRRRGRWDGRTAASGLPRRRPGSSIRRAPATPPSAPWRHPWREATRFASAAAAALHVGAVVVGGIGPAPLGLTTEPPARLARDGRSGA